MNPKHIQTLMAVALWLLAGTVAALHAQPEIPKWEIELEAGPVWQSRNDVQIPNDDTGTRFSLVDLAGNGPWFGSRFPGTSRVAMGYSSTWLRSPIPRRASSKSRSGSLVRNSRRRLQLKRPTNSTPGACPIDTGW